MQDVPALLASLHGLSVFEDQGEWTRDHARDREQAAQEQQEHARKEQEELDRAAALRLQQYQQRREDAERRQATQAEAAKARQEKLEREQRARAREDEAARAYGEYGGAKARQRPAAGRAPATTAPATTAPAVTSAAPPGFSYKVHACIAATSAEIATMITDSEARTRRLQDDLATKRREEASYGHG
jgi:hypothetical protein